MIPSAIVWLAALVILAGALLVGRVAWFLLAPLRWRSPLETGPHLPTPEERAPLPPLYPGGWIPLLSAHELRPGEVRQVRALGRLFAVYRGESGRVAVTDAFCPHLGANLAEPMLGASVVGDCLRCPFHGWQFDAVERGGECVRVPYAEKLPRRRATLGTHLAVEQDGLVWVWHGAGAPSWTLPEPEPPGRLDAFWELELGANVQDIMENQADLAHAGILHLELLRDLRGWRLLAPWLHFVVYPNDVEVAPGGRLGLDWSERDRWLGPPPPRKPSRDDWRVMVRAADPRATDEDVRALRRVYQEGTRLRDGLPPGCDERRHPPEMTAAHVGALALFGGRLWVRSFLVIRQVGPCLLKISMAVWLRGRWRRLPVTVRMAATPVGPCRATIRVSVRAERRAVPRALSKLVLGMFYLLGMQDFRIWNSKSYRARPPFVDGDGHIPAFRKWYARFFSDAPVAVNPAAGAAEEGEARALRIEA